MAKKKAGKKGPAASTAPVPRGKTKGKPASGGPIRALCRFLGSAELAIALLFVSAGLLAWATLLESARGSEIAQWYFYHSRWFIALMGLLGLNVLVAMILRWPWKKRHVGFLVAHFGLIVLLAGSMWSLLGGVEGRLTFVEGETADTILVSDRSQLTMSWREGGSKKELILTFAPGPVDWPVEEPLDFGESDGFRVRVLKFYRHARPEVNRVEDVPHARREVTFQPVEFAPGESQAPEAAALFEIAAGGETQRVWLQRGGGQHGFQSIPTPKGPAAISFGYAQRPLGFSLRLVDFQRGRNPGGMGDASYASAVELTDESLGLTRQCTISMNEPLRHGKFTFYQSGFDRTTGGREVSRLSAAYDPGRFLKYSGCLMMCVGTFVMFYWKGRRSKKGRSAAAPSHATDQVPAEGGLWREARALVRSLMAALTILVVMNVPVWGAGPLGQSFDWYPWRSLPVQDGGRRKPLDTLAREACRAIGDRAAFTDPKTGAKLEPAAAYLQMLFEWQGWDQPPGSHAMHAMGAPAAYFQSHQADEWDRAPLFPVDHVRLRRALGVAKDRKHVSLLELTEIRDPNTGKKTPLGFWARKVYHGEDEHFSESERKEAWELSEQVESFHAHRMGLRLNLAPIRGDEDQRWWSLADLMRTDFNDRTDPSGGLRKVKQQFREARAAYLAGSTESFDEASAALIASLRELGPQLGQYPNQATIDLEVTYNHWMPFRFAWILTSIASVLLLLSIGTRWRVCCLSGLTALGLGLAAMLIGLGMRTVLKGSPPVTNLYESVVFAGFGTVLFGLAFGLRSGRQGILAAALVVATLILALADNCPSVLDPTLRPLPPVLRSNFWLAVHVATIMLSYAAFAVALGIGNVTLGFYLIGSKRQEAILAQSRFTFKSLQAGVLLLVVGTFLGAAWADYSWGRFWGWDPKEVWALITLLGYLAILHGRYAGWVGNRGLAAGSVICFVLVLMTWYGVNFLSGGLHNYGLGGDEGPFYVLGAVGLQLLYVIAAIIRPTGHLVSSR